MKLRVDFQYEGQRPTVEPPDNKVSSMYKEEQEDLSAGGGMGRWEMARRWGKA